MNACPCVIWNQQILHPAAFNGSQRQPESLCLITAIWLACGQPHIPVEFSASEVLGPKITFLISPLISKTHFSVNHPPAQLPSD